MEVLDKMKKQKRKLLLFRRILNAVIQASTVVRVEYALSTWNAKFTGDVTRSSLTGYATKVLVISTSPKN